MSEEKNHKIWPLKVYSNLNAWSEGAAKQIALPHNSDDFFSQVRIRNNALAALEIFKSPDYKLFQDAINSEMKGLARKGAGVVTK